MEAPASEEAAAPRSAGTERRNAKLEFGMGAQQSIWPGGAPAKAVFTKLYHACNDTEYSRAALLPSTAAFVAA